MVSFLKKTLILLPYLTPSPSLSPQYGNLCVDADSNIFLASITASLLHLSLLLSLKFPFHPPRFTLHLSAHRLHLPSLHFSVSPLPSHLSSPTSPSFHHIPLFFGLFLHPITLHSSLFHFSFPRHHKWTGREQDLACLPIRVTLPRAVHHCILGTLG